MKTLIIAALIALSAPVQADKLTTETRRLLEITSELSGYCVKLAVKTTVNNKACQTMLDNLRLIKTIDDNVLVSAIQSAETKQHVENIRTNAKVLAIVRKHKKY